MDNWAFRELQEMLAWKDTEYGVRVEDVNPASSSQPCSKCGQQSSTNRGSDGWFEYNECRCEMDGDYNASKNIGKRPLASPEGERPLRLGDGHLGLKSGTLNLNGDYVRRSVGRRGSSTLTSTALAVGR
ncbi:zinc ribbon domain-containing protein [Halomicrococcus sp. SG-WS-1]|uniref:zinc ribbon domain-containing protein n=1 Tax=Halomicrococcus sp. SG-WS-1 TaxID=3439057 RepID=UPI003F79C6A1